MAISSRVGRSTGAAHAVDCISYGTRLLEVKYFRANVTSGSTDAALISAVANHSLVIISFRVMAGNVATSATFNTKPGGAGSAISETFQCGINGGQMGPFQPVGHFKTNSGEGLTLTTGSGSTVGVGGAYVEVPDA